MTIQHWPQWPPPQGIAVAENPGVLMKINTPGCVAAIWERHPLASFQDWLNGLDTEVLPDARLILRAEAVHEAIAHLCHQTGMPSCPERGMLEGDIAALAHMFADVASADYLRVRLDVLEDAPTLHKLCKTTTMRLICVYRGPCLRFRQTAQETHPLVSVSAGAPIVVHGNSLIEHDSFGCRPRWTQTATRTCLVLTLDPVADVAEPPANKSATYH